MPKESSTQERRHDILDSVQRSGRVFVADLSQSFGVSEVTIRSDLQMLADQGLVVRTHGGAIPAGRLSPELSLALRRQQQPLAKDHIGAAGAELIEDGDAVYLDTSSTALAIARHLTHHRYVTVVTNSIAIVNELTDCPNVHVVVPGGRLRRETASLIGADGLDYIRQLNIQKGFFGAHGVTPAEGLTDVSVEEAEVKRVLVGLCRQVVAVLDATKWGRVGVASFATLEQVDVIITDQDAPAELVAQAQAAGVAVHLV
ncbi:MAG TPA: DeoR/GlpR family DNA-binding transcription regulator [Anaerolineae bacterium]|nr:DeoR/GlpR family DNA-binding transcription regulator [Anaerolineae bacterium]HNU03844.1 DeoR/GlpR family DNA-binding transcription regulator [Anaerolineae bacterium]